jgi:hypothetical protein
MSRVLTAVFLGVVLTCSAQGAEQARERAPAPSLKAAKGVSQPVDARGFVHRWLVLEPLQVPGRLTESAVEEALQSAPLSSDGDVLPRDGEQVTLNGATLTWHALDTANYNFNLYHFARALSKPTSNATDFCARFLDENDQPVRGLSVSLEAP